MHMAMYYRQSLVEHANDHVQFIYLHWATIWFTGVEVLHLQHQKTSMNARWMFEE